MSKKLRFSIIGTVLSAAFVAGGILFPSAPNVTNQPVLPQGGGPTTVVSSSDSAYHPVSPTRILDTRRSSAINSSTYKLEIEGSITVINSDGTTSTQVVVPNSASAVAINLTVTEGRKTGGYGYVTAFPCINATDAVPNSSSLNFENNVDIANALNVSTSVSGDICLYVYGEADLIVDVAGYFDDDRLDDIEDNHLNNDDDASMVFPIYRSINNITYTGTIGVDSALMYGTLNNGVGVVSFDIPAYVGNWSGDFFDSRRLKSVSICFPANAFSSGGYVSKIEIFNSGSSTAKYTENWTNANAELVEDECPDFTLNSTGKVTDFDFYNYRVDLTISDTSGTDGDVLIGSAAATFESYAFIGI
jgi:hypothetical protein